MHSRTGLPDPADGWLSTGFARAVSARGPHSTYLTIYAANEVWFALGDMTMAEHAAILGMIFSPHHTGARAVKRLAEINLVNGDERRL